MTITFRKRAPIPEFQPPVRKGDPVVLWDDEGGQSYVGVVLETPASADADLRVRMYDPQRVLGLVDAEADGWIANPAVRSPWRNLALPCFEAWWMARVFPVDVLEAA